MFHFTLGIENARMKLWATVVFLIPRAIVFKYRSSRSQNAIFHSFKPLFF